MKKCSYCGKEYPDEAIACEIDAVPFPTATPPKPRSSTAKEPRGGDRFFAPDWMPKPVSEAGQQSLTESKKTWSRFSREKGHLGFHPNRLFALMLVLPSLFILATGLLLIGGLFGDLVGAVGLGGLFRSANCLLLRVQLSSYGLRRISPAFGNFAVPFLRVENWCIERGPDYGKTFWHLSVVRIPKKRAVKFTILGIEEAKYIYDSDVSDLKWEVFMGALRTALGPKEVGAVPNRKITETPK